MGEHGARFLEHARRSRVAGPGRAGGTTAQIILLASYRQHGDQFTLRDRHEIATWRNAGVPTGARAVIHQTWELDTVSGTDFMLIYQPGHQWATWGMARQQGRLGVWRCATGVDLGFFATAAIALRSVMPPECLLPTGSTG